MATSVMRRETEERIQAGEGASERETCLIKIPSRISADTRIARSRLSLSLSVSDRPPRDGVGNLPLVVVVRSCCVVFSLLLIAGERERERGGEIGKRDYG